MELFENMLSRVDKFENALVWMGENGTFWKHWRDKAYVRMRALALPCTEVFLGLRQHFRYRISVDGEHFMCFQIYQDWCGQGLMFWT